MINKNKVLTIFKEKIEDWLDLKCGLKALKNHQKNPNVTSHKDLIIELGIKSQD